jgi:transposase
LTTKIHAVCDAQGRPTDLVLTQGQASDLAGFDALSNRIKAEIVIGDKGYDADDRVREVLRAAGKTAVIPPRSNRKNPEQYAYDKELYKKRHRIENFFSRLKDFRGIATRYEKTSRNFLAGIHLAAAMDWIN